MEGTSDFGWRTGRIVMPSSSQRRTKCADDNKPDISQEHFLQDSQDTCRAQPGLSNETAGG
jgi:hypothetical protein